MTATQTRQIEFITALSLPKDSLKYLDEIASQLEEAVRDVVKFHPKVVAYLAQPVADLGEVHIGFRFDDVDPDEVDEWAEDLLAESIEAFKKSSDSGNAKNVKREDTSFLVA